MPLLTGRSAAPGRRRLARFPLLALALLPALARTPAAQQPNVLVFVADDLGAEQIELYGLGSDYPSTPTLDALAAQGVLFRNAWSYPICTPTRATLQTGRYGFRTGLGQLHQLGGFSLELDELVLPEMLAAGTGPGGAGASYAHAFFGKWHLASSLNGGPLSANLAGWSHYEGTNYTGFHSYSDWHKNTNGVSEWVTDYHTTDVVDDALAWIGQQASPWLACVAFVAPHTPHHAPPAELHTEDLSEAGPPASDPRPYFRAMVEAMDTEMGRLLDGLGDALDDTLVVFVADNGTQDLAVVPPWEPYKAKSTLYQAGIHVPLVVAGPGVAAGAECDALVSTVDLYATIAEVAGVDLASVQPADLPLDSVSLLPYLEEPTLPSQRAVLYSERFTPNGPGPPYQYRRAATDGRYKVITRSYTLDELYDLEVDPTERFNLLNGDASPEALAAYEALSAFLEDVVLPWPASVFPYGCDVNPLGSLTTAGPPPVLGSTVTFALDNPLGTSAPGDLGVLLVSIQPYSGYPCGLSLPGLGLAGGGAPGEVLVGLFDLHALPAGSWAPGQPATVDVTFPAHPAFAAAPWFLQGALLGAPGSAVAVGLTQGLKVQVGLP